MDIKLNNGRNYYKFGKLSTTINLVKNFRERGHGRLPRSASRARARGEHLLPD